MNGYSWSVIGGSGGLRFRIAFEIGLCQEHDRRNAGLSGRYDVTFYPFQVEVPIQAGENQNQVYIGRDVLWLGPRTRSLPEEAAAPGNHLDDQRLIAARVGPERDPVAGNGPQEQYGTEPSTGTERGSYCELILTLRPGIELPSNPTSQDEDTEENVTDKNRKTGKRFSG